MLFDPRWTREPKPPSFSKPSLEGFAVFVAFKLLHDPEGEYYWPDGLQCAVGQYLRSIGCWSYGWHNKYDGLLWQLDSLAHGEHVRDRRGRFTANEKQAVWRWRDVHKRLQLELKEALLA